MPVLLRIRPPYIFGDAVPDFMTDLVALRSILLELIQVVFPQLRPFVNILDLITVVVAIQYILRVL